MAPSRLARVVAEFTGTFTLVFTACNDNIAGGNLASFSVCSSLMVSVYSLGSVSGANFNPAVSFALALVGCLGHGDMSGPWALLYAAAQLGGGLAGACAAATVWLSRAGGPSSSDAETLRHVEAGGRFPAAVPLGSPGGYDLQRVLVAEAIYTAVLVFVVLNVATCGDEGEDSKNHIFALAIAFVINAGASAIGHISGCSLNPAVSFGVAMASVPFAGSEPDVSLWRFGLYSCAELIGAFVAVLFFAVCRQHMIGGQKARGKQGPAPHSKMLAEFLGTYVLVLTVSLVVAQADHAPELGVLGIASSLMVMIYALAAVSGANFNPAVSFALLVTGNLPLPDFVVYIPMQLVGGIAAVATAAFLEAGRWKVALVASVAHKADAAAVAAEGSWGAIAGAEIFYTFLLVFVVLNVAVRDGPNQYYGLAIAFVIVAGGVAVGGLSGACFNPAVAISLDFAGLFGTSHARSGPSMLYTAFELLGAGLAAAVYVCTSATEETGADFGYELAGTGGQEPGEDDAPEGGAEQAEEDGEDA